MLALERLSPLERVAFLLHDVIDIGFDEIAGLIGRTEAACRQLAARARGNIRQSRPRFEVPADTGAAIVEAFMGSLRTGSVEALAHLLAENAVLHSDGGGKRKAALRPIYGRDRILKLYAGLTRKFPEPITAFRVVRINGLPGCILASEDGSLQTMAFEISDGKISGIYAVRNPDKLARPPSFGGQRPEDRSGRSSGVT